MADRFDLTAADEAHRRKVAQLAAMSRGLISSAISCGVVPRLKPMIHSASSGSVARTRNPLISRKREHGDQRSPLVSVHEGLGLSDPMRWH